MEIKAKNHLIGLLLALAAVLLADVNAVYLGYLTQGIEPALICGFYGIFSTLFFLLLRWRFLKKIISSLPKSLSDLIGLNVVTMANWIGYIFALKYLEPAITVAIIVGIGPVCVLLLGRHLRPHSAIYSSEKWSAAGTLFFLFLMTYYTYLGKSGIGKISNIVVLIGVVGSLVSGIATSATTIYIKNLTDKGWKTFDIMIVRFFLLILASLGLCYRESISFSISLTQLSHLFLSLPTVIIPLCLFVMAIRKTEAITVSLLLVVGPLFTFFLQLLDHRLNLSYYTLLSIVPIVAFLFLGMWVRYRSHYHHRKTMDAGEFVL